MRPLGDYLAPSVRIIQATSVVAGASESTR
jgi:hypothetical protein